MGAQIFTPSAPTFTSAPVVAPVTSTTTPPKPDERPGDEDVW